MEDFKTARPHDTAGRLIERDDVLLAYFNLELVDQPEVHIVNGEKVETPRTIAALTCRAEACGAAWDVLLDQGRCPIGPRNSLLAHSQRHAPGYVAPFRRRS